MKRKHALAPITNLVRSVSSLKPYDGDANAIFLEMGEWFNSVTHELTYYDCDESELSEEDLEGRKAYMDKAQEFIDRIRQAKKEYKERKKNEEQKDSKVSAEEAKGN